jgi:hypothetical protein
LGIFVELGLLFIVTDEQTLYSLRP